jgi:hypothetical protein
MRHYEPGHLINTAMNLFEMQRLDVQYLATPFIINSDLVMAYVDSGQIVSMVVVNIKANPMRPGLQYAGPPTEEYFPHA